MHRTTTALLAVVCLALAGCSASTDNAHANPKTKATKVTKATKAAQSKETAPKKLAPVWGPKLESAAGKEAESTAACQLPSSNACARYVGDIMEVVRGLGNAIDESGRTYPASTEQMGEMTDAEKEYEANGCQGDPTADDPDSLCHGVVGVTIGASTLGVTLLTDEAGM